MSIYIFGAFIDYLYEQGINSTRPMREYKAELLEWKKQYNNR